MPPLAPAFAPTAHLPSSFQSTASYRPPPPPSASKSFGRKKVVVKSESYIDEDGNPVAAPKRAPNNTGYNKPMRLSRPLADLLGVEVLGRPQVVKELWVSYFLAFGKRKRKEKGTDHVEVGE